MKKIYLIDGSSYIYRAFYAMRNLSTSSGMPTNALYIITRMLLKLLNDAAPEYICFVQDTKGPTHRHERYEAYKANRQKMPEDLQTQIPHIQRTIDALGIPCLAKQGMEADDLIATLARGFSTRMEIVIISGDKDLMQLVGDRVRVWDTLKDRVYDPAAVKAKYGVAPEYIADLLALMGDKSDNVPGVAGVGQKGAVQLITQMGHLDNIIQHRDKITSARQKKAIDDNINDALLSYELVRLDKDTATGVGLDDFRLKPKDDKTLARIFEEMEFFALAKTFSTDTPRGHGLVIEKITYTCNPDITAGAGIYLVPGLGYAINNGHQNSVCLDPDENPGITGTRPPIIMHDAKQAIVSRLKKDSRAAASRPDCLIPDTSGIFDTMLAAYCIDAANGNTQLETLAKRHLGLDLETLKDLLGSGRKAVDPDTIEKEKRGAFLAAHAQILKPLKKQMAERMEAAQVTNVYSDIEIPLMGVLASMEVAGVGIDTSILSGMSAEMGEKLTVLEEKIYHLSGRSFNIHSPKQLGIILFDEVGLPVIKKTRTGYSTDNSVLETLAKDHELPGAIIEYRSISKLKNTYVDALPRMIDPWTKRIHSHFNQAATATGRISSSDPNLQNIPVRTIEGRRIREAFLASSGYCILSADYSQIELRVLAHITGDPALVDAFEQDMDIHAGTASEIFGIALDEVDQGQRRAAKIINFGIMYGMGPHRLSKELGIGQKTAKAYIENYLARYPGVKQYMEDVTARASQNGYVSTMMGRRRGIKGINSQNFNEGQAAKRIAVNTPIQGSAADIIKLAMIQIDRKIEAMKARMIIQVHDELLFEVPTAEVETLEALVKNEMETVTSLRVPLKVDIGIGENWAQAH